MSFLNDAKLVHSKDFSEWFQMGQPDDNKINGYVINEPGERLQTFLVDDSWGDLSKKKDNLLIS